MSLRNLIAATYAPMHKDTSLNLEVIEVYGKFLKRNKVAVPLLMVLLETLHHCPVLRES
jgi:hypothetical protein